MQMTIKCLAILVVAMCLNGCYALTGCPGSAQCDPSVADGTDSGSKGDASSGIEVDGDNTKDPCLPYKWINSPDWNCYSECALKTVSPTEANVDEINFAGGEKICVIKAPNCEQMQKWYRIGKGENQIEFYTGYLDKKMARIRQKQPDASPTPNIVCEQYEK